MLFETVRESSYTGKTSELKSCEKIIAKMQKEIRDKIVPYMREGHKLEDINKFIINKSNVVQYISSLNKLVDKTMEINSRLVVTLNYKSINAFITIEEPAYTNIFTGIDSKGRLQVNPNHRYIIGLEMGLLSAKSITPDMVVALILHEIGHAKTITPICEVYNPYNYLKALTAIDNGNDIDTTNVYDVWKYLYSKTIRQPKDVRDKASILILAPLLSMNSFRDSRYFNGYTNELIADSNATKYGYGKSLAAALSFIEYTLVPREGDSFAYCIHYLMLCTLGDITGVHPRDSVRIANIIRDMEKIRDDSPDEIKPTIQKDINIVKEYLRRCGTTYGDGISEQIGVTIRRLIMNDKVNINILRDNSMLSDIRRTFKI